MRKDEMPVQPLNLRTLAELDLGKGAEAFQRLLKRAVEDCMDRPGDKTARKVALEIHIVPIMEQGGDCTEVAAEIHCTAKVPTYRTKPYSMGVRKGGHLVFNPDSPDNINQSTFIDEGD